MDTNVVAHVRATANRGIDALERRQADQASVQFANALAAAATIEDAETRRDETAALGNLLLESGFPEFALLAFEDAIDLDRLLGLKAQLGLHMLEAGKASMALGNEADAEQLYRDALDILLTEERFADAASASTNLGVILADRHQVARGIALLQRSLDYLAKAPFPATEKQTRLALLQMYEHAAYNVDCAVDNARQLFAKFGDTLHPQQREVARAFVCRLSERFCRANPEIDRATWTATTFPLGE
jgi:tetratricopeptide (TPR) repeat protein